MRKITFYWFVIVCVLSLFTSCLNQDDKNKPIIEPPVPTYKGENLQLTFNGHEVTGQSVSLMASDNGHALVFIRLIPGCAQEMANVEITPITKSALSKPAGYRLSGDTELEDGRTISVEGKIEGDVMTLQVDVRVHSSLVGTWILPEMRDVNGDGKIDQSDYNPNGSFFLKLQSATGTVSFGGESFPDVLFNMGASLKGQVYLASHLKSITLQENGYVVASYSKDGKTFTSSPEGFLSYYIKDNKIYLVPDMESFLKILLSKSSGPNVLEQFLFVTGIPFGYITEEKGGWTHTTFFLNKAMIEPMKTPLSQLYLIIKKFLPAETAQLVEEGMSIVGSCKEIELGLNTRKE